MAKIILDSGLATEKQFAVDAYYEHPLSQRLNGSKDYAFDELPVFPEDILTNPKFTTITIKSNSGITLPIINDYNKIVEFEVNCYDEEENPRYGLSLGFGYEA